MKSVAFAVAPPALPGVCSFAWPGWSDAVVSVAEEGSLATFSVRPVGASSSEGWTGMVWLASGVLVGVLEFFVGWGRKDGVFWGAL